jgi:hypothetical protein
MAIGTSTWTPTEAPTTKSPSPSPSATPTEFPTLVPSETDPSPFVSADLVERLLATPSCCIVEVECPFALLTVLGPCFRHRHQRSQIT